MYNPFLKIMMKVKEALLANVARRIAKPTGHSQKNAHYPRFGGTQERLRRQAQIERGFIQPTAFF